MLSVAALLAAGGLAVPAHAAPKPAPVVFGAAAASPKTQTVTCPATVRLATKAKVKAPVTLKYRWIFSNGDKGPVKTYRVGGKGLKNVRLTTTVKIGSDAAGWGRVYLASPVKKLSKKAYFKVTCTGGGSGSGGGTGQVATGGWVHLDYGHSEDKPTQGGGDPGTPPPPAATSHVKGVTLSVAPEPDKAVQKCPKAFELKAVFDITGAPATAFTISYRVLASDGTPGPWLSTDVPANHGTTHEVKPPTFETSASGWRQIEVNQPATVKSNQAEYKVECTAPGITLGKSSGLPGETISVTVVNGKSTVKTIVSEAFDPAAHTPSRPQHEYAFNAVVSGKAGVHEVKAVFADGTEVKTTFTVEENKNPVKGAVLTLEASDKDVQVCPKTFAESVTFDITGAPAKAFEIKFRTLASNGAIGPWQTASVAANHGNTHTTDLGKISVSQSGWHQIEVQQPDGLKSNQAAYNVECTRPAITLSAATGKPGDKVKVTVVNGSSDIKTITSNAFSPATHTVGTATRQYSFDATVAGKAGAHEVKAVFADGTDVKATFTVEQDQNPVKQISITLDPATHNGRCPKVLNVKASLTVQNLPSGEQVIQYRYVGEDSWRSLKVPANHPPRLDVTLDPVTVATTTNASVTVEINQPSGTKSNTAYYRFTCANPAIVVDEPNIRTDENTRTVTVDGIDSEVRTIESSIFKQTVTQFSGKTKVVHEAALKSGLSVGSFRVFAKLADGTVLQTSVYVYKDPVVKISFWRYPPPPDKVDCPYTLTYRAQVDAFADDAPLGRFKILYRIHRRPGDAGELREATVHRYNKDSLVVFNFTETFTSTAQAQTRHLSVGSGSRYRLSNPMVFNINCR
ncbi:hypothetical protein ACIBG7_26950 [Nonomuraea sp. NPDC050328]|uniref:hypothetical protein n=1 Tax=Nonomuraea sp. NPDC050328 TaxID=3364361 RepID=UPI00379E86A4